MQSQPDNQPETKSEVFVRLLSAVQRKLFLYVLTLVPRPGEAEEIVQDVSAVLWRRFDDFREGEDFFRWACGIARYEVLKHWERRAHQARLFSPEFLETLAADAVSAVENADRRRDALDECLRELRPHHRQLLSQRYLEQMSTDRLAELYGKSVEAIRRMLHRIRLALLRCVEQKLRTEESPGIL